MATRNTQREGDEVAARELALYARNHSLLNAQRAQPIIRALALKLRKGTYDPAKAVVAWGYLAEAAAREFSDGRDWSRMFDAPTRRLAARELADYYDEAVREAAQLGPMTRDRRGVVKQNPAKPRTFLITSTMRDGREVRQREPYEFSLTVYLDNRALKLVCHADEFGHPRLSDPESGFKFADVGRYRSALSGVSLRERARDAANSRVAQLKAAGKDRFAWSIIERARERAATLPIVEV